MLSEQKQQLLTEIIPEPEPEPVEVEQPQILIEMPPKRKYKIDIVDDNSTCSSCSC
jgi:hypothetical protein